MMTFDTPDRKKPSENILEKGENSGTSTFSFSYNVFYSMKDKFDFFGKYLSPANAFNLDRLEILSSHNILT